MKQNSPFGAPMSGRTYDVQSDRSRKVVDTDNFTSNLNGWRILSSQTSVTLNSGRMRVTGTAIWATAQKVYVNIKEGAHYILKFKLDMGTANGFINVPVYNRPITALSPNWISTNKSGEYIYRFKAIDDTIRVFFELTPSNTPGSIIFVDDVTLEEEVPLKVGYRFGFNGKEKDNETYGEGNAYDFGARIYDSRLGRWLSVDPLVTKYPSLTPYSFAACSPIILVDGDGREVIIGKQDQSTFMNDMTKIFGSNASSMFTFQDNKLMVNNVTLSSQSQKNVYDAISKVSTDKAITRIVYTQDNGRAINPETNEFENINVLNSAGEVTITKVENPKRKENTIYVFGEAENGGFQTIFNVKKDKDGNLQIEGKLATIEPRANNVIHGIGHVIHQQTKAQEAIKSEQGKVIDLDNDSRKAVKENDPNSNIQIRNYDETHPEK